MPNVIRHLVNDDGQPFNTAELRVIHDTLDALTDVERTIYRNSNAQAIAEHPSLKTLIVSGPGTGKSTIFKQRIGYWLGQNSSAKILALSFVRKLVADLHNDIRGDVNLTSEQKDHVEVHTLHKYARSIVEQNHGTSEIKFHAHFKIINDLWINVVWDDTLLLINQIDKSTYSFKNFSGQLHNLAFETSPEWQIIIKAYFQLSKFYNAVGFGDLILHAKSALLENSSLISHEYFIIDEYQDFNIAEEEFIKSLTQHGTGVLIVGDDDQVLYEKLKSGKAELIRDLYRDINFTNTMLPFCGRSSFHISKTSGYFIKQSPDTECIDKIYLPISTDTNCPKIQIIGCATAPTAVDYIKKFIEEHKTEIETRKDDLENNLSKDPFLLILTPAREVNFYSSSNANKTLFEMVAEYKQENKQFSIDYYKVLTFYSLASHPENNFVLRKAFYYENVSNTEVSRLIKICLQSNKRLNELTEQLVLSTLAKSEIVKTIIDSTDSIEVKVQKLTEKIDITDQDLLKKDLIEQSISTDEVTHMEHREEESAELEELEVKQMSAVELLTLVGSKGLSADHVIIIGFDNQNMSWVTKNAFYVAMTRARKSLHIITALGSGGSQQPHDFLSMLPDEHIEFFKYTKTDRQKSLLTDKAAFLQYFQSLQYNRRARTR